MKAALTTVKQKSRMSKDIRDFSLSKKYFRQAAASFLDLFKGPKNFDDARMAQATLSCRCAAIHLATTLMVYLRAKCRRSRGGCAPNHACGRSLS